MNIVIVGPGSIGSLWAHHLILAGHSVSVWLRQVQPQFQLQLDDHPPLCINHNNPDDLANADLILVTTKVWQIERALTPLLGKISSDTIIVLMHNGMGAIEELYDRLSAFPLILATTTHGAKKEVDSRVRHTGIGSTQIGPATPKGNQCEFLSEVLHHAFPDVVWNSTINKALWLKLIINCVINPLTAIEQCNNGALRDEQFNQVIHTLLDELISVARAEGFNFEFEEIKSKVYHVISSTAINHSSMHQDIVHQRKTEIDYITGYLLKCANKHQIAVPENKRLYQMIKQMEQGATS